MVYPHFGGKIYKGMEISVLYRENILFHRVAHGRSGEFISFRRLKGTPYVVHIECDSIYFPNRKWDQSGSTSVYINGVRRYYNGERVLH